MNILKKIHKLEDHDNAVCQGLQSVLSSTYGLYLATHNYHWNVEGSDFLSLHKLFEEQYNRLFKAIDVIAERIRALNSYVLPFESDEIMSMLKTTSNAISKETDANARAIIMVYNLIKMNEKVIESCQSLKKEAQDISDDESENLMVERITDHQKSIWMLKSIIKQDS
ncbi:MAG: DNA starvation/stationary phase protection protein [Bacteroides sp.]|jgi:starvation-inducible DNA-binding protein|nr:DNA starvation/stationary phase protection protein [Bacteroides sp.]